MTWERTRNLLTLIGAFLLGTGSAVQAQVPRPGDIEAKLDPSSLVSLSMDGASTNLNVTDSTASIALVTPRCVPTALGCLAEIEGFRIDLSSFTMDTTVGHFQITNPSLNMVGPVVAKDSGSGYVVPAGTVMAFSGNVSANLNDEHTVGPLLTNQTAALVSPVTFTLSTATQDLTIDGSIPFQIEGTQGDTVTGTVTIMATGQKPFLNTPPNANAGPDQTVSCGQQITLNGSQSTDLENNITSYLWSANGNIIATGAIAHVNLPSGTTSIQLNVQDSFFASGVDLMMVASQEAAPVFTFVPPALQATGCGPQNIGQAQATSTCGAVTITNDAPASFPVGQTLVTWTATSPSGMTTHATQRVTVFLGDDPRCCPSGTNVIVGTSNNDTLTGTTGADCIVGLGGQDTINGLGGNDIISGGDGDDTIHGGDGDDLISGGTGQDQVFGDAGNDTLYGGDGDDHVDGGDGNDVLFGGQGQDTLICGTGTNQAFGGTGDDTLQGGPGNDILDGGPDHNTCISGGGSDQFISCTTVR